MNIFASSACPIESAKALDDKRIVKMCLGTAQLLCTALHQHGIEAPYKATHVNHPCNKWAAESGANWKWLWQHGLALCAEYTARYGKEHKCESIIRNLESLGVKLPDLPQTPFVNCARNKELGIDCTQYRDTHRAYQVYLNQRWETDKRAPTFYGKEM